MDSRSYESHMDWEYQDSGPYDPTSPFTHAAKNNTSQFMSSSPSKAASQPNPFAGFRSPTKPQSTFPQNFRFTPQLSSKNAASPFRNPAFTTPRRPVDEVVLSEASGAEDSPALTETPDAGHDTLDADRNGDWMPSPTNLRLKVDKTHRYGKPWSSLKKHTSGKGEIRTHRDQAGAVRKRKRHNNDKDISSMSGRQWQDWGQSETDSDDSFTSRMPSRSRDGKKPAQQRSLLSSLFHILDEHPNAPDNISRWIQLMVNFFLVSGLIYVAWSLAQTVRRDINNANEAARLELLSKIAECQNKYTINECYQNKAPALREMCDKWHDCLKQNPESIMRIKATAKHVAEIINEFSEAMNLKAWAFFIVIMLGASASNILPGRLSANKPTTTVLSRSASSTQDAATTSEAAPGYMLVPVQTPRMQRYGMLDEGTDTDTSPLNHRSLLSYHTPSGRRSPSKGERSQSPTKYLRGPSKEQGR